MPPAPFSSPVTLRDVARAAGVSHVTVSLALRNNPQIPAARRAELQELARRLGYRPNAAAITLALHKRAATAVPVSAALAWLNRWPRAKELRSFAEFDRYWRGAYEAADKFGYRLEEFVCGKHLSPARLEKILHARGILGILLPPHPVGVTWDDFRWERFSALRFGRSVPSPRLHVVTSDQVANTMLAFREMRARGYERIGFVTGHAAERGALYKAGFHMAQEWVEAEARLPSLTLDDTDAAVSRKHLARWLRETRPDAILSDVAALGTMLPRIGCRVPEDVGLAALSILDGGASAGINQNPEEIGRVAVLLILSLINDHALGVPPVFRQILVEGSWVDGDTLPVRRPIIGQESRSAVPRQRAIRRSPPRRGPATAARRSANPAGSPAPTGPPAK